MAGKLQRALFEIAEDNYGYFTVRQAADAGVSRHRLADLARLGSLQRVAYGVYRIVDFPATQLDSYFEATLWPQGTGGVLSHETALDLWDLCDVNPAKVHLTVARTHRVRRQVPDLYVMHHDDLDARDITSYEGIPTTTVVRTLRDCTQSGTRHDLLEHAIGTARSQGMISEAEQAQLTDELLAAGRAK